MKIFIPSSTLTTRQTLPGIPFPSVTWWCCIRTGRTQAIMWIPLVTGRYRSLQRNFPYQRKSVQRKLRSWRKQWKFQREQQKNIQRRSRTMTRFPIMSLRIYLHGRRTARIKAGWNALTAFRKRWRNLRSTGKKIWRTSRIWQGQLSASTSMEASLT